jgi:dTDP-glucose 4,6-dehydratase/UDP-glucose 4-epimerase
MGEEICYYFSNYFGVQSLSLRLFSVFGPGLYKQIFWDLFQKCHASASIEIFGTGDESRDYIYIKDLVRVFLIMIEKGKFDAGIYNVANGREIKIRDAVNTFIRQFKWNGNITYSGHQRKGDPLNWCADTGRIQSLGYVPQYSLEQGLEEYITWLQEKK